MVRMVRTVVAANLQVSTSYRLNFVLGILSVMVLFWVHYNLWKVICEGNKADMIGGYTFSEMIVYVGISRSLFLLVNALNVEGIVAQEIKSGELSTVLVKPVNYLLYRISSKAGDVIVHFVMTATVFTGLFMVVIRDFSLVPGSRGIVAVLCTTFAGMLINTLIGYIFALTAFWMDHVDVMFVSKRLVLSFVSSVWIPISFFPDAIRSGSYDLTLTKPMSTLFLTCFKTFDIPRIVNVGVSMALFFYTSSNVGTAAYRPLFFL